MNPCLNDQERQSTVAPAGAICHNGGRAETTLDDAIHRDPCHTGGLNCQSPEFVGHIHYLTVACYVEWGALWGQQRKLLSETRFRARFKGLQVIEFGGRKARLLAKAPALGNDPVRMSYYLIINGVVFMLSDRRSASGFSPNVMVQVPGQQCLRWQVRDLMEFVRGVIRVAGGEIVCEKLSRVDLALDLLDVTMDGFWAAYEEQRFITRVKHHLQIGGTEGRTLYFGKPPLSLCIYDKTGQLEKLSGYQLREELMLLHRLWGRSSEAVTRVEYRLYRDALKEHGIDSPDDLFRKLPDLIGYLTSKWIRLTRDPVDRMNPGRALTLPLWTQVAEGFQRWAGAPQGASLAPLPKVQQETGALAKQLLGLALTHAARVHGRVLTVQETLDHAQAVLAQEIVRINLQEAYGRRIT